MRAVKLYDKDGNYKERFTLPRGKSSYAYMDGKDLSKNTVIRFLNKNGLFLKSQVKVKYK